MDITSQIDGDVTEVKLRELKSATTDPAELERWPGLCCQRSIAAYWHRSATSKNLIGTSLPGSNRTMLVANSHIIHWVRCNHRSAALAGDSGGLTSIVLETVRTNDASGPESAANSNFNTETKRAIEIICTALHFPIK
ncbi:hypothetical protein Trydic_g7874 [Trypoxylus dichotomus]